MLRTVLAGSLAVLALAACGDDAEPDSGDVDPAATQQQSAPEAEPEGGGGGAGGGQSAGGWTGLLANTYKVGKQVCGSFPLRKVATDLGLPPSSDAVTVAEEYAKGSTPEHQQPAFEGCLDGLP